jgi:autoinducer 2-degrading protein
VRGDEAGGTHFLKEGNMIVRLVAMRFQPGKGQEFVHIFTESSHAIRTQRGCLYLSLLQSTPDDFVTISHWQSHADLEAYRHGEVFGSIWPRLKVMFRERAWAETFEIVSLPVHNTALEMANRLVEALNAALAPKETRDQQVMSS